MSEITRLSANQCRLPEPSELVCRPGKPDPDAAALDAVFASHGGPMRQSRLGRRPQLPGSRPAQRPPLRPAAMPADHRRPERGIGAAQFNRRIGDTYTTILNLRGVLDVKRDQLTDSSYKMFGVLLNQQERALATLENKPGTTTQIAELRRVQATLDDMLGAINGFAAHGSLTTLN